MGITFLVCLFCVDIFSTGLFGGGERALAIARSILLPGLAFLEWNVAFGAATIASAFVAVFAWMRWGADWILIAIVAGSIAIAAFVMPIHSHGTDDEPAHHEHEHEHEHPDTPHHDTPRHGHAEVEFWQGQYGGEPQPHLPLTVIRAGHEFLIVLIVFAAIGKVRLFLGRFINTDWLERKLPDVFFYRATDVSLAVALNRFTGAGSDEVRDTLSNPNLIKRAILINCLSRFRWNKDPLRHSHAVMRASMALAGILSERQHQDFRDEAANHLCGVPDSEPTWVRLLDSMVTAIALEQFGEQQAVNRWRHTLETRFKLHGGRRAAAVHSPSMLGIGTAKAWEHATATALGFRQKWLDDADWAYIKPRALGAASGGENDLATLRLVAAGKLWAALLGDKDTFTILERRNISSDAIASALNKMALQHRV